MVAECKRSTNAVQANNKPSTRPTIPCSHCQQGLKRPTPEQRERYESGIPVCCSNKCRLEFAQAEKIRAVADLPDLICADPECGQKFRGSPWQYKQHDKGIPVYHTIGCARRVQARNLRLRHGNTDAPIRHKPEPPVRCPWETGALRRSANHVPL